MVNRIYRTFNPNVSVEVPAYNPYSSVSYDTKIFKVLETIVNETTTGDRHTNYSWLVYLFVPKNSIGRQSTMYLDRILRRLELTGLILRTKRGHYRATKKGIDVARKISEGYGTWFM